MDSKLNFPSPTRPSKHDGEDDVMRLDMKWFLSHCVYISCCCANSSLPGLIRSLSFPVSLTLLLFLNHLFSAAAFPFPSKQPPPFFYCCGTASQQTNKPLFYSHIRHSLLADLSTFPSSIRLEILTNSMSVFFLKLQRRSQLIQDLFTLFTKSNLESTEDTLY